MELMSGMNELCSLLSRHAGKKLHVTAIALKFCRRKSPATRSRLPAFNVRPRLPPPSIIRTVQPGIFDFVNHVPSGCGNTWQVPGASLRNFYRSSGTLCKPSTEYHAVSTIDTFDREVRL